MDAFRHARGDVGETIGRKKARRETGLILYEDCEAERTQARALANTSLGVRNPCGFTSCVLLRIPSGQEPQEYSSNLSRPHSFRSLGGVLPEPPAWTVPPAWANVCSAMEPRSLMLGASYFIWSPPRSTGDRAVRSPKFLSACRHRTLRKHRTISYLSTT